MVLTYKLIDFNEANDNKHKYQITFQNLDTKREKTIKFGAYGMGDYIYYYKTLGKNEADKHKDRYIKRHSGMNEDYENMLSKGALSMRILWNKPTLKESLIDFVKYFIKKKKLII